MNKFIMFIFVVLAFLGCEKQSLTSKSLAKPIISLIVDGTFDDKSFGEDAWKGAQMLEGDFGVEIIGKASTSTAYASDLEDLKDKGSSIIWGVGFRLQEATEQAAALNKGVNYGIVDVTYEGDINLHDNLLGLSFKVEEASFLAGYLAAKTSKTGKIGFLGGMESVVINAFRYGYEAGAKYANKNIELNPQYVGSFVDLSLARTIALNMYKDGTDVIFIAAGLAGLGAIEVSKELGDGYYIVGVDQDQSHLAPDNVLTSVVKNVGNFIYEITKNYLDTNDFDGGKVLKLGLKNGSVSIIKHDFIKNDIKVEIETIEDKIVNGDISVPSNLDGYNKFLDIHNLLN
ncbi:basic membrane protein A [Candidatus Borrelia fainii]|uniref:Basic membrane protein A n=1 Tax=Candidatus Borrelia fainii TaxID=2518322 RepID=A0ABN6URG7_9SPIR|nr:BMP family protein [Candidatus Borrelia fainii]BDU62940.1 basic membrane protein A [Candidatus Borrelia fainii]